MPRSNREYLLRYADEALNDIDRALTKLKYMSDMYGGIFLPLEGETLPQEKEIPEEYEGNHGQYQKMTDLIAAELMMIKDSLTDFRTRFM